MRHVSQTLTYCLFFLVPVCPFEKGFVLTEDDRCVCPEERGFYVDENGNCQRCPVEVGFVLTEDGRCICDPEKGYILTHDGICDCPITHVKSDDGICVIRTEPPPPAGCTIDEECPTDKACDRGNCVPPCGFDPCAKAAICVNMNHRANCTCIAGYSGDPYKEDGCKELPFWRTDFPRPEMLVNCLADGVQVDINIDPAFNGVMYVKGYSKNEECRRVMRPDVDTETIDFKVKFNTCGLVHENGLARFILVLQKHPKLVTYKAQAYHVKCTYNTGEKTITIGFNVSMLTTAGTIANTGPPPTCLMKITDPDGDSINKAEIGDLLMLRIQVEPSNIYGGYARNCIALTANTDGTDNEHLVTDEHGCATDPSIFGEWELDEDGKILVAIFSAFKFPASNSIRFQCNVRVCFGRCHPVNCNGYDAFGKRRRRDVNNDAEVLYQPEAVYDGQLREIEVQSQSIFTVETRTERFTAPQGK
ncbi:Cuticlin-1 [Portunus trituberculatus]|uniref:Cuticlin-1 n=1 Tax=Portunus trituberculatus TaxID=210409 RepID=A0A5B7GP51_PORTR|nr:Cuticlin-1 [Portunus trituberculatus]